MNDMASTIVPKSDQLNSDDLIAGPITIRIAGVTIRGGQEQPISVHYEGDNGKPYKPCKSMCRVMVTAWGADSKKYIGRSMTLYRDEKVKWAGMDVGGIRISHMSDIDSSITMALTVTRANKKPFTVKPIAAPQSPEAARPGTSANADLVSSATAAALITDDQVLTLDSRCQENGINVESLRKAAGVARLALIETKDYERAVGWIDAAIAKRKSKQPA